MGSVHEGLLVGFSLGYDNYLFQSLLCFSLENATSICFLFFILVDWFLLLSAKNGVWDWILIINMSTLMCLQTHFYACLSLFSNFSVYNLVVLIYV